MLLLFFFLLGFVTDMVKETNKIYKETKSIGTVIQNIFLVILLVGLLFLDIYGMTVLVSN